MNSNDTSNSDQVTQILQNADKADCVSDELLPLVYDELRRIASAQMAMEKPGQTIQPTALVHEAYMRLIGSTPLRWDSRAHFFGAAARSMRQILINRANRKKAVKHGGEVNRVDIDHAILVDEPEPEKMLALDVALEKLERIDPRKGQIVMLRYFAGLSVEDTAKAMDISVATVKRDWQFARTWLHREMSDSDS
ncbi:MAG: sigma-70 family RNA polymerase sigma factor [Planctomycetota bacterium]